MGSVRTSNELRLRKNEGISRNAKYRWAEP